LIDFFFLNYVKSKSKNFFEKKDLIKFFSFGDEKKINPEFINLKNLYILIRERKPKHVVEFGSGFSTIAIALALRENKLKDSISGTLYSVEDNKKFI